MDQLVDATTGEMTTHIEYDAGGRKIGMMDPDMGHWEYAYDASGNLKLQTDARGCRTALSYDRLNRVTMKTYFGEDTCANTPSVSFHYDTYEFPKYYGGTKSIGRRTEMVDGSGTTSWFYDERGRTIREYRNLTDVGLFAARWSYNDADLVTEMQ